MNRADNLDLPLGWGTLRALVWPNPGGASVLCLHGWMDNAASFAPLAPYLDSLNLVALDLAGHGHSDHRPDDNRYYFTEYLFDLDRALNEIGWESCILVGHSLGGGIASCYAAMAPERVRRLLLLDGIGPVPADPGETHARLRQSLASVRDQQRHARAYAHIEDAARVRAENTPMNLDSALLLAQRALGGEPGEYRWRTDPRLMWTSPLRMTEAQALDVLAAVHCPTLAITTGALREYYGDRLRSRLEAIPRATHIAVEGGHHFHMDDPAGTAPLMLKFLAGEEPSQ